MSFFGFKGTLTKKVAFQFLAEGFSFLTPPTARVPPPPDVSGSPLGASRMGPGAGWCWPPLAPHFRSELSGNCAVEAKLGPQSPFPDRSAPPPSRNKTNFNHMSSWPVATRLGVDGALGDYGRVPHNPPAKPQPPWELH